MRQLKDFTRLGALEREVSALSAAEASAAHRVGESEARFRALLSSSMVGVFVADDEIILESNRAFADLVRREAPEEAGQDLAVRKVARGAEDHQVERRHGNDGRDHRRLLQSVSSAARGRSAPRREQVIAERARLAAALAQLPSVRKVWPSAANFLLVEWRDPERAFQAALGARLLIRDVRSHPALTQHLRITVGTPEQNERLLRALEAA